MPNFIKLLIENYQKRVNSPIKTGTSAHLDTQAVLLFHEGLMTTPRIASGRFNGNPYTVDLFEEGIDRRLTTELSQVNLRKLEQYVLIQQAIQAWKPAPMSGLALQNCQKIRQALRALLPQIRKKQQLNVECRKYKEYLETDIKNQLRSYHPKIYEQYIDDAGKLAGARIIVDYPEGMSNGKKSLNIALEKYAVIHSMQRTLQTSQPVSAQLTQFRQVLDAKRAILEKDRDTAAMIFVKAVTTICSLGLAVLFGIWKVKGQQVAQQMSTVLQA